MLLTILENYMVSYGWWLSLVTMGAVLIIALISDLVAKKTLREINARKQAEREARQKRYIIHEMQQDKTWFGEHSCNGPLKSIIPPTIEGEPIDRT